MADPASSSRFPEHHHQVRYRLLKWLRGFCPGPGTYISAFCIGTALSRGTCGVTTREVGFARLAAAIVAGGPEYLISQHCFLHAQLGGQRSRMRCPRLGPAAAPRHTHLDTRAPAAGQALDSSAGTDVRSIHKTYSSEWRQCLDALRSHLGTP